MNDEIKDIINYNALSKLFGKKKGAIRKNKIPDKYSEAIQELYDYVETWAHRHKI